MTVIESIFKQAIDNIPPIKQGGADRAIRYEFGIADDLIKFIARYQESHFPMIWLTPVVRSAGEFDAYVTADVTINICTRETRKEKLNTERLDLTLEQVLNPTWIALRKELRKTHRVVIEKTSVTTQFIGDYKEEDAHLAGEIWDVLQVTFTGLFYPEYCCKSDAKKSA